jgi:hypothetical protein
MYKDLLDMVNVGFDSYFFELHLCYLNQILIRCSIFNCRAILINMQEIEQICVVLGIRPNLKLNNKTKLIVSMMRIVLKDIHLIHLYLKTPKLRQ